MCRQEYSHSWGKGACVYLLLGQGNRNIPIHGARRQGYAHTRGKGPRGVDFTSSASGRFSCKEEVKV